MEQPTRRAEKTVAQKLMELRGERTQLEVSDAVNISKSALSMYETGNRIPRDEIKKALSSYYHVSVQELFYE